MRYLYYVIFIDSSFAHGPMPFKEAVMEQKECGAKCVIVKIVIDEEGKEVK